MKSSITLENKKSNRNKGHLLAFPGKLWHKLGLWPRLALAISLGFLLVFALLVLVIERAFQDSISRQQQERLAVAQMAAGSVENYFSNAANELYNAYHIVLKEPLDPVAVDNFLRGLEQVGYFPFGLFVQDPDGHIIDMRPTQLFDESTDLEKFLNYYPPSDERSFLLSAPFLDPLHQHPVIAITVPIEGDSGILGYLSGLVSLESDDLKSTLYRAINIEHTEHAVLVNEDGRVIVSTLSIPFLDHGEHEKFYREMQLIGEPGIKSVPFELDLPGEKFGHEHIMAYIPLDIAPWGFALGGDSDEYVFASIEELRLSLVVIGSVTLIIIWLLTLIGTKTLTEPINQLTVKARKIAAGNMSIVLSNSGSGEIGEMTMAIESMRRQLTANIAELASWNSILEDKVNDRTAELRQKQRLVQLLSRKLIHAQERERTRLALELHDEIAQTLTAIELSLSRLAKSIPDNEYIAVHDRLNRSRNLTEHAIAELRRIISALRPSVLDQFGLLPALQWNSDLILQPVGIDLVIGSDKPEIRYLSEIETILFRIAQEAMANVAKHSRATLMEINIKHSDSYITMTMTDNGTGQSKAENGNMREHLGIQGMHERASLVAGKVTLERQKGLGTTVTVQIPLEWEEKESRQVNYE